MYDQHYFRLRLAACLLFATIFFLADPFRAISQPSAALYQNPDNDAAPHGCVSISGVAPRPFDATLWARGSVNLVPAIQSPFLSPLPGAYRNIYAPSVVETAEGWRIFYGGWDGLPSGHDHVYSLLTQNFVTFTGRGVLINPGAYQHVCNVNAIALPDGTLSALCTVYPDAQGLNGIAAFQGLDSTVNAGAQNLIKISGYPNPKPDFNGMNAQLFEDGQFRVYFGDTKNFGQVQRASSQDGKNYEYEGPVLTTRHCVNDVKKFQTPNGPVYLMALHRNGPQTWYSLSSDGENFGPELPLIASSSPADHYIVALGWIAHGAQEEPGRNLLGLIYGAGASASLDANRIFVRWLQFKLVFVSDDGRHFPGTLANGVNTQILPLNGAKTLGGVLQVYAEDGRSLLCSTPHIQLNAARSYQLHLYNLPATFSAGN